MELVEDIEHKAKRRRINPVKKWTVAEEKALIKFLLENRDFEKPSSQVYYKRFIEQSEIELTDWKLARSKVRNMRTSYNKAKAWEGSTGAGSMEGETMKSALLKMCSFYYEFEDIFGSRLHDNAVIEESLDSALSYDSLVSIEEYLDDNIPTESQSSSMINMSEIESDNIPSTSRKGIYSRTAMSDIFNMETENMKWKQEKLIQDKAFREKELEFKERELALKERELEIKVKEIESKERIKIKELEMKERLEREEMKLKYGKN